MTGFARVVVLPFCQGLTGHNEADIAGLVGLEVHIRDHAPLVEGEIAPAHCPDLTDAEPAFVEHHDDGPVAAAGAGAHHRGDLFGREQVRGNLGHGLVMGCLEGLEFLFRDCDVLILDQPEVKLFEDDHVVGDGVLHELPAPLAPTGFQCCNAGVECSHIVFVERADEASPADKCVRDFVRTFGAGVAGRLQLSDEGPDERNITFGNFSFLQCSCKRSFGVICLDLMKGIIGNSTWGTSCHKTACVNGLKEVC